MDEFELRLIAIERKLKGESVTSICNSIQRSRQWLYKWVGRYNTCGIDGLKDMPKIPISQPTKIKPQIEEQIVKIRRKLQAHDSEDTRYSPIGAESIQWELIRINVPIEDIPSISTINRIIKRNNLMQNHVKYKKFVLPYPEPPADNPNEVHQLDTVGPRFIKGINGVEKFYSINLIDCYSRMVVIRPCINTKKESILDFLTNDVWSIIGIPKILQVDNMLSIKGSNRHPRSLGLIIKICLMLGIEILFIPINEPQRNGIIEKFNDKFDKQFFRSQSFNNFNHLKSEARIYQDFCNQRYPHSKLKVNIHGSKIPYEVHCKHDINILNKSWRYNSSSKLPIVEGKVSFIRFIRSDCKLNIFSEQFVLPTEFKYKYIKATIFTKDQTLFIDDYQYNSYEIGYKLNQ